MEKTPAPHCASCKMKDCAHEKDCFNAAAQHRALYENENIAWLHKAASAIEARHYCKAATAGGDTFCQGTWLSKSRIGVLHRAEFRSGDNREDSLETFWGSFSLLQGLWHSKANF